MTGSPAIDEIDSLCLLAHKVAPRVFDLSSLQSHVSIRDQMVRAQLLVRDLYKSSPQHKSLLIVGMGVAGLTAALAACQLGFERVCVVDAASEPLSLLKGVHARYVGPYMYEWPSPFHGDQSYPSHEATPWAEHGSSPLRLESREPLSADALRKAMLGSLRTWAEAQKVAKQPLPLLLSGCDGVAVQGFVKAFVAHERRRWQPVPGLATFSALPVPAGLFGGRALRGLGSRASVGKGFAPDHIILAAGMGAEVDGIPGVVSRLTPPFWSNDGLKSPGNVNHRLAVLGGGDGAMQDALRFLTRFDHPLSLVRHLEQSPAVRRLLESEAPALLSADRQMRQAHSWSGQGAGHAMVDQACRTAAANLAHSHALRELLLEALRPGTGEVHMHIKGPTFDKAYLLNRFLIYLLARCLPCPSRSGATGGHMTLELHFNSQAYGYDQPVPGGQESLHLGPANDTGQRWESFDLVVVRFGIQAGSVPGLQMIQLSDPSLSGAQGKQRTTLKRVELPFVAMALNRLDQI